VRQDQKETSVTDMIIAGRVEVKWPGRCERTDEMSYHPVSRGCAGRRWREPLWRPRGPRRTQSLRKDLTEPAEPPATEAHPGVVIGQQGAELHLLQFCTREPRRTVRAVARRSGRRYAGDERGMIRQTTHKRFRERAFRWEQPRSAPSAGDASAQEGWGRRNLR
jgi:hypothetical protein